MTLTNKQTRKLLLREIRREKIKRKKYFEFCNLILKENQIIVENKKYLTQQEINESFLDTLTSIGGSFLGKLLPGFISDFKQKIATNLIRAMNLNPRGAFGRIVVNVFEEFKYTQIMKYFSDWKTGCPMFIETFLKALSDAIQEYLIERFLGAQPAAKQSGIAGAFREGFTETVNEKIIPMLKPAIEKFICNMDISAMLTKLKDAASGDLKGGEILSSITGAAAEAGKTATKEKAKSAATSSAIASQFNK